MNREAVEACNWQEPGGPLGMPVAATEEPDSIPLGMTISKGVILIDPAKPVYPGEEMAAIAWSAAATAPCEIGVPMLAGWDMTAEPHRGTPELPAYPIMTRWLRGGDPAQ